MNEDYQALMKIMERARKLAFMADEDPSQRLAFVWIKTAIWKE